MQFLLCLGCFVLFVNIYNISRAFSQKKHIYVKGLKYEWSPNTSVDYARAYFRVRRTQVVSGDVHCLAQSDLAPHARTRGPRRVLVDRFYAAAPARPSHHVRDILLRRAEVS